MTGAFAPLLAFLALSPAGTERLIVVAPPGFRDAIAPLVAHRSRTGVSCEFLAIEEPVEEGRPSRTDAVRAALATRLRNAPAAVLLVGDGAILPAPGFEEGRERVASDDLFLPEGRGAIGRLPARNADEARLLAERVIAYETAGAPGPWRARVVFTAGEGGFGAAADRAIEAGVRLAVSKTLPPGFEMRLVRLPALGPDGSARARDAIVDALAAGSLFWIYAGHGSPRGLASGVAGEGFLPAPPERAVTTFRLRDVGRLRCAARPPVALLFACQTAEFGSGSESLAEALVRSPEGPIAVLGATAVSHPVGDLALAFELGKSIAGRESVRLGAIVASAKDAIGRESADRALFEAGATLFGLGGEEGARIRRKTARHYALLGDPLLRIAVPAALPLSVTADGNALAVEATVDGEGEGTAVLEVDEASGPGDRGPARRVAAEFSGRAIRIPLDASGLRGESRLRVYVRRGEKEWAGEARWPEVRRP